MGVPAEGYAEKNRRGNCLNYNISAFCTSFINWLGVKAGFRQP